MPGGLRLSLHSPSADQAFVWLDFDERPRAPARITVEDIDTGNAHRLQGYDAAGVCATARDWLGPIAAQPLECETA